MSATSIFQAKNIVTMNRDGPFATHVAVRDGRILAVGDYESVGSWGDATMDTRFADKVLMPGFVEGHSHLLAGGMWIYTYIGYHDRISPDGKHWPGVQTIDMAITRLREAESSLPDQHSALIAWGFDPIFLDAKRLDRFDLDEVSTTRPIAVVHSNFHLMTINSHALDMAGYDRQSDIAGMGKTQDGEPNGELQEMAAMFPVMRRLGVDMRELGRSESSLRAFGDVCKRCGVTTATDLHNFLPDEDVTELLRVTGEASYPVRLVPMLSVHGAPPEDVRDRALALRERSTDKLRLGGTKIVTDGSIQGFTARLRWPGYYRGPDHGLWNIAPPQLQDMVDLLNASGIQMHIHVNGDEASDVALDALENALTRHPVADHRHTLQHCQLADHAQFRRMRKLGLCVNLFANHIYYFGDQHYAITIGPDRATRIDACATALEESVPLAIHSDAPVTPMGPLFTAWCAVNRRTASNRTLGAHQKITVDQALHAITLGAAYTLKMDDEVGSIEIGKKADFAVLEEDPTKVPAGALKDIEVWGTVLSGQPFATS